MFFLSIQELNLFVEISFFVFSSKLDNTTLLLLLFLSENLVESIK